MSYYSKKRFPLRPVHITSAVSTFIFAMIYGLIEHMLLASPIGLSVLTYPMSIHLVGQLYFYHIVILAMAILVSFNPFIDRMIFRSSRATRMQGLLWGTGNILNFIWLEDMFYFILFGEWPKDVMTPLHVSFYGIVWWYPVACGGALFLYYLTSRIIRRTPVEARQQLDNSS
jgi:hypothetical protein